MTVDPGQAISAAHEGEPNLLPYASGVEMIADVIGCLDEALAPVVERFDTRLGAGETLGLPGITVTAAEARRLLAGSSRPHTAATLERQSIAGAVWNGIASRIGASRLAGISLPLDVLRERFGLSVFETECLLLCLAPEADWRYEKLYGYLNDDLTRRYPSVHLLVELLTPAGEDPVRYRRWLLPESHLQRTGILCYADDAGVASAPVMGRCLRVESGIVRFLLEEGSLDSGYEKLWKPPAYSPQAAELWAGLAPRHVLETVLEDYLTRVQPRQRLVCVLAGRAGSGRRFLAETVCAARGLSPLAVDCRRLLLHSQPEAALTRAFRDSALLAAPLLLDDADCLFADRERGPELLAALERLVEERGWLLFVLVENPAAVRHWCVRHRRVTVDFPDLTREQRRRLWLHLLEATDLSAAESRHLAEDIAAKFRLTPGQMAQAFEGALAAPPDPPQSWTDRLHAQAAAISSPRLSELAQKLKPIYRWEQLVLPERKRELLRDILRQVHYRRTVMEEWGFEGAMSRGKGLTALFSGPPGTGKTMAAEVIANELKMDLYRINLATVVSKYIGETEKNLARIFGEAERSDVILFFDEADALFGKRSEVRDAHDRYANIEINYLLQQMESYEGIAILATNLRQNLDEAFLRRIHIVVEFPFPSPEDRLKIWSQALPEEAPRNPELDFNFLARNFELSGGNIQNIALTAAFLAAEQREIIAMDHLVQATRRELEKLGKRFVKEEFGLYSALLDPLRMEAAAR